jgi:hypothetical protein
MLRAWENPEWDIGMGGMQYPQHYGHMGAYPMHPYSSYAQNLYAPLNAYGPPSYPPYPGAYPAASPPATTPHSTTDSAPSVPSAPPTMPLHSFAPHMHSDGPGYPQPSPYGPSYPQPGYPQPGYPQHSTFAAPHSTALPSHPFLGSHPQSAPPPPPPPPPPVSSYSSFASGPSLQPNDALAQQLQAVMESLKACGITLPDVTHAAPAGMSTSTPMLDLQAALRAVELASR